MSDLTKANRRIKQLEKCLTDVHNCLWDRMEELERGGRNGWESNEFFRLKTLAARIRRTMKA